MENFQIPILFIIFNRPEIALGSFEKIKQIAPRYLYIASDGARTNIEGEEILVNKTRDLIINEIDWDCEVKTLFQKSNLGCGKGVYTAINWLFENEELGIILEDDCIADLSFFKYMEEMLIRYKNDYRIGMISGTNPIKMLDYSYSIIFSKYKSCWGWATWKRAWNNMDINMSWRQSDYYDVLYNLGYLGKDISGWKYKIKCIDNDIVSAWDWQWYFSLAAQNQLCVYPIHNLVSNVGNDTNATHTSFSNITLKSYSLNFPLKYPNHILPNKKFDYLFYKKSNNFYIKVNRLLPYRLKRIIKRMISNMI